jgi:endoglucanase
VLGFRGINQWNRAMQLRNGLALLLAGSLIVGTASAARVLEASATLYVDNANNDIGNALRTLKGRDRDNALLIAKFPIASWISGGTAIQVTKKVGALVSGAAAKKQIPILVAYNLPFRDCQQYSSGGAVNTAEYKLWIDSFAAAIGSHRVVVLLEPDGLGIIPHFTNLAGEREWCQPKQADSATAAKQRFAQLNYAVDVFTKLPNASVYLDGTHSGWLDVGDIASRLLRAGVQKTSGFFLNVSNYYPTPQLIRYGTWVSQCLAYASSNANDTKPCASYTTKTIDEDDTRIQKVDAWYANQTTSKSLRLKHFVIDTSRNGQGTWVPPENKYKDPEQWCNPPGRGIGERPTTVTSHPLVDAKLWIKVPGESDGECKRSTQGAIDPERGMVDPPAGKWFKEQAEELIRLAVPGMRK